MSLPYSNNEDVNIFMNEYNEKLNKNRCISRLIENDNYINNILDYNVTRATRLNVELNPNVYEKIQPSGTIPAAISPGMIPRLGGTQAEALSTYTDNSYNHHFRRYLTPDVMADAFNDDAFSVNKSMIIDIVHLQRLINSESIDYALNEIGNPSLGDGFVITVVHRSRSKTNQNSVDDVVRSFFRFKNLLPVYIGTRYGHIYHTVWRQR